MLLAGKRLALSRQHFPGTIADAPTEQLRFGSIEQFKCCLVNHENLGLRAVQKNARTQFL